MSSEPAAGMRGRGNASADRRFPGGDLQRGAAVGEGGAGASAGGAWRFRVGGDEIGDSWRRKVEVGSLTRAAPCSGESEATQPRRERRGRRVREAQGSAALAQAQGELRGDEIDGHDQRQQVRSLRKRKGNCERGRDLWGRGCGPSTMEE